MAYDVTLIPGDGIGPEITQATRRVLEATGVAFNWNLQQSDAAGSAPSVALLASLRETGLVLKGPTAAPMCFGDDVAVFEPAQDAAPQYAGMNKASPLPMINAGVRLLRYLGEQDAAERLERVLTTVVAEGKTVSYDLKPDRNDVTAVGTSQVADSVVARLLAR